MTRLPSRLAALAGTALAVFLLSRCASLQRSAEPGELVVAATTDFHGGFDRAEGLASVLGSLKERFGDHLLFVDGGDLFQGSLEANLSKGRAAVALFNELGLDVAAIGNHDLDYGPDVENRTYVKPGEDGLGALKARAREARFRWLSANMIYKGPRPAGEPARENALGQATVFEPHAIFQRAGRKVCVIGVTTPETPRISNPAFSRDVLFAPLVDVVAAESRLLRQRERCDFVLLAAHAGLACPSEGSCDAKDPRNEIPELLDKLPEHAVDAVIAGHTHISRQTVIRGTAVLEPGAGGYEVGVLRLRKSETGVEARLEPALAVPSRGAAPPDAKITAVLRPYRERAAEVGSREAGAATADFVSTSRYENPLHNLVADALLEAGRPFGATMALVNSGGLGGVLPAGKVTYGDIFNALTYDNVLAVTTLEGRELKRIIQKLLSRRHGLPVISGLKLRIRQDGNGRHLLTISDARGRPLADRKHYVVATLDYLAQGGDELEGLFRSVPDSRKRIIENMPAREAIAAYLSKRSPVNPARYFDPDQPRIVRVSR